MLEVNLESETKLIKLYKLITTGHHRYKWRRRRGDNDSNYAGPNWNYLSSPATITNTVSRPFRYFLSSLYYFFVFGTIYLHSTTSTRPHMSNNIFVHAIFNFISWYRVFWIETIYWYMQMNMKCRKKFAKEKKILCCLLVSYSLAEFIISYHIKLNHIMRVYLCVSVL